MRRLRQSPRQYSCLVEASLALAFRMKWHRHHQCRFINRVAPAGVGYQASQPRRHVRFALEFEDTCSQRAFIESARSRRGKRVIVAAATTHLLLFILGDFARRYRTAFPANGLATRENLRALPACSARYSTIA